MSPRHRLSREAVEVFKARVERALSNLVSGRCPLHMAEGLELDVFKVPSRPSSMTLRFLQTALLYSHHC